MVLELLLELVALHEIQQIRRRLPVFHGFSRTDCLCQAVKRACTVQVLRQQGCLDFGLPHHGIPVLGGRHTFGSNHDSAQTLLQAVSYLNAITALLIKRDPKRIKVFTNSFHVPFVVIQKTQRVQEVLVMILFFAVQGEHLVRCGRQQQHPYIRVVHELHRQFTRLRFVAQQVLEPLKLVQNDEIGLQRLDTGAGQALAKVAN